MTAILQACLPCQTCHGAIAIGKRSTAEEALRL
jgi:hypothetical protein